MMNSISLSNATDFHELYLTTGTVLAKAVETQEGTSDEGYCIRTAQSEVSASLAASCLLVPNVGDVCSVAIDEQGRGWLLAILVQANPSQGVLSHAGQFSIQAQGTLHLSGQEIINDARAQLHLSAPEVSVHSDEMAIQTQEVAVSANKAQVISKTMSVVADKVEHVVGLMMQKLSESFRVIKGHDEKQSGSSRQLVEKEAVLHAKNVISSAEKQMIMEAEKIHLG
ncbi:DUF3540 domain-containing protein [uncultured Shewanella sp.]|uniref:DUF3540 domain-containing protein n=1 Tax=uncultured Shewanella sp. TaxID=173975 RepID=UPI002635AADE|nr:DUF3540 domain-containing protein [uncultured Shewanella sp.]